MFLETCYLLLPGKRAAKPPGKEIRQRVVLPHFYALREIQLSFWSFWSSCKRKAFLGQSEYATTTSAVIILFMVTLLVGGQ